jgi:hypothetical protein
MKKRYEDGGEVDAMEEANKRTDRTLANPNAKEYGESGTSYTHQSLPLKPHQSLLPKQNLSPPLKPQLPTM